MLQREPSSLVPDHFREEPPRPFLPTLALAESREFGGSASHVPHEDALYHVIGVPKSQSQSSTGQGRICPAMDRVSTYERRSVDDSILGFLLLMTTSLSTYVKGSANASSEVVLVLTVLLRNLDALTACMYNMYVLYCLSALSFTFFQSLWVLLGGLVLGVFIS
jgi:hypothetical protein